MSSELLPEQRGGLVMFYLMQGEKLRTYEIAQKTGLSNRQALRLLTHLEQVLPVYVCRGLWQMLDHYDSETR